jgi:hypothetical protein
MRESERAFAPQFSRADAGWIFTTSGLGIGPRSWRGPERSYRVDDRQKAELLARLYGRRLALQPFGVPVVLAILVAWGFALWSFHHSDWLRGAAWVVASLAIALSFGEVIGPALMRLAIRPILAQATPTATVSVARNPGFAGVLMSVPRALARRLDWRWLALGCLAFAVLDMSELMRIGHGFDPVFEAFLVAMSIVCGAALRLRIVQQR